MSGFEFTPLGPVPLGQGQAVWNQINGSPTAEVGSSATPAPQPVTSRRAPLEYDINVTGGTTIRRAMASVVCTKPGDIVRAARARVKQINAELRRHEALRCERDELQRLITAAKTKPRATVRAITSARSTG